MTKLLLLSITKWFVEVVLLGVAIHHWCHCFWCLFLFDTKFVSGHFRLGSVDTFEAFGHVVNFLSFLVKKHGVVPNLVDIVVEFLLHEVNSFFGLVFDGPEIHWFFDDIWVGGDSE